MMAQSQLKLAFVGTLTALTFVSGCASNRATHQAASVENKVISRPNADSSETTVSDEILPVQFAVDGSTNTTEVRLALADSPRGFTSLTDLETQAVNQNPSLVRLYRDYQAATSRARYVDELPDPKAGANIFGNPIETASGSQRANISVSQMIPWLKKLNAQEQQACFEALAIRSQYQTARLTILADVRTGWYRLYVIDKQIQTTLANQQLLQSLIEVANARVSTGAASQGDVLLGTLELSQLEERLLSLRRQRTAVQAEINRLTTRPAALPIDVADDITANLPEWTASEIYEMVLDSQPELDAARLRTQATRWGIEVARLSRRPEVTLSANYFPTDDNRPSTRVVNVGEDPWSVGAQVSIPLWREKYDAMRDEATWKYLASHESLEQLKDQYDALTIDLLSEARRASETATLYRETILPQARQTLQSDQDAYANGNVDFDRVVRDFRNLLTLELGYYQATGELAISIAKIQRAVGHDLAN